MKNKKDKKFDAVQMMREIRDKLVNEYSANLKKEEQDLFRIRKKYGINRKQKLPVWLSFYTYIELSTAANQGMLNLKLYSNIPSFHENFNKM